jgi:hypothetical protein
MLLLSSAAYGAIFGWTDSEGTAHFTNRESEMPLRYRDKAKLMVHKPTDSQTPQQTGQTMTSPQSATRSEVPPTGVSRPVSNPEQKNDRKVQGVRKRAGRHLNPPPRTFGATVPSRLWTIRTTRSCFRAIRPISSGNRNWKGGVRAQEGTRKEQHQRSCQVFNNGNRRDSCRKECWF